ncbi:CAAX amino terminal protease self- immunity [Bacteroidales bacterium Barb4]|nr:CAAX amino terminal protease self- immunity [Bacteroidales bacterium Barb4]
MNAERKEMIVAQLKTWGSIILFLISWFFLLMIFVVPLLLFGIMDPYSKELTQEALFFISLVMLMGTLTTVFLWTKFKHGERIKDIGFELRTKWKDLLWGMFYGAAAVTGGFLICYITGLVQIVDIHFTPDILIVLFTLILVAAGEEILSRGYLLRRFMKTYNKYAALGIASLLFMAAHLANQNISTIGMINLFLAGILLGIYYIYKQNLWFPIGLHFTWNFFQSVFGFEVSGMKTESIIVQQPVEGMEWLTGGAFGFEGSVYCTIIQVLCITAVYFQYGRHHTLINGNLD